MLGESAWSLHWDEQGLIPAVVQDATSGQVLMVAWMNAGALERTLATGETHFWSRSRAELWHKGATSGNTQRVTAIWADCDGDTLLVQAEPAGPACHTGEVSCFYRQLAEFGSPSSASTTPRTTPITTRLQPTGNSSLPEAPAPEPDVTDGGGNRVVEALQAQSGVLRELWNTIEGRKSNPPPGSYTAKLFAAGLPRIAQKVGEEGVETVVAGLSQEDDRVVAEMADLVYHCMVLLAARNLSWQDVEDELARRFGYRSGSPMETRGAAPS
jgi:phosphoribosyl-AMP cyclohydrolase / phosphoribosyl-ATP pyrophosphohydrolase